MKFYLDDLEDEGSSFCENRLMRRVFRDVNDISLMHDMLFSAAASTSASPGKQSVEFS